jgi:GNAT superfamily N-acetyltransferase
MEIRRLNKEELKKFIDSDEFNSMPVIPITKHKALSYLSNPRASDDDILLLIALEDNRMVGYLSILPDFLYDREAIYKAGWLSAFWVDPSIRRKGVAGKLLREALDSWNNHILVADWVPNSFGVYQKSGAFTNLLCREGIRAYLRFNLRDTLPLKSLKSTFFGKIILIAADRALNMINSPRLYLHSLSFRNHYPPYEISATIDHEIAEFISPWKNSEMFRRLKKELMWILKYPWVLEASPRNPKPDKRFYFSSVCNQFRNEIIKIRDSRNKMIAFLMLTIRNKSLEIPYLYYNPDQVEPVARFIYRYIYDKKIRGVTLFDAQLSEYILTNRTPFISRQKVKRPYIITKTLAGKLTDHRGAIQDGDGESVFT